MPCFVKIDHRWSLQSLPIFVSKCKSVLRALKKVKQAQKVQLVTYKVVQAINKDHFEVIQKHMDYICDYPYRACDGFGGQKN